MNIHVTTFFIVMRDRVVSLTRRARIIGIVVVVGHSAWVGVGVRFVDSVNLFTEVLKCERVAGCLMIRTTLSPHVAATPSESVVAVEDAAKVD